MLSKILKNELLVLASTEKQLAKKKNSSTTGTRASTPVQYMDVADCVLLHIV
jgi:hypothetical protein